MIMSFDIMNENDYKKIFIDPLISTVHRAACFFLLISELVGMIKPTFLRNDRTNDINLGNFTHKKFDLTRSFIFL